MTAAPPADAMSAQAPPVPVAVARDTAIRACHSSAMEIPALNQGIRPGEHQTLMAVGPTHQIWRLAVRTTNFQHFAVTDRTVHMGGIDHQPIAN
jgi:hypothetical protein